MAAEPTFSTRHNLLITTPNTINLHTRPASQPLFECSTTGIITAKAAKDNSGLIAIADGRLVLLYDIARKNDRKYILKNGDGSPRILLFTPDSQTLIFTTTLSTAIQAYSIATVELLPPLQSHPSPPNVVAISSDGAILLSASSEPPVILLQDFRTAGNAPFVFRPEGEEVAVTCASFQDSDDGVPSPQLTFLLGFRDGTLTLFGLRLSKLSQIPQEWRLNPESFQLRQPVELNSYKRLHKPEMGGVMGSAFLPGYRSRIVTVGHDGKCRIVECGERPEVLRTWRITGPATCLSVLPDGQSKTRRASRNEHRRSDVSQEGSETLIAIGTQTGHVLVYNMLGLLVQQMALEMPIVEVEWVGDMSAPRIVPNPRRSSSLPKAIRDSVTELYRPVLDPFLDDVPDEIEEGNVSDSGTIRRSLKKQPSSQSVTGVKKHQIDLPKDLFSPAFHFDKTLNDPVPAAPQDTAEERPSSPALPPRSPERPEKTYYRPRIAISTFKVPDPPTKSRPPGLALSPTRAAKPSSPPPIAKQDGPVKISRAPPVVPPRPARSAVRTQNTEAEKRKHETIVTSLNPALPMSKTGGAVGKRKPAAKGEGQVTTMKQNVTASNTPKISGEQDGYRSPRPYITPPAPPLPTTLDPMLDLKAQLEALAPKTPRPIRKRSSIKPIPRLASPSIPPPISPPPPRRDPPPIPTALEARLGELERRLQSPERARSAPASYPPLMSGALRLNPDTNTHASQPIPKTTNAQTHSLDRGPDPRFTTSTTIPQEKRSSHSLGKRKATVHFSPRPSRSASSIQTLTQSQSQTQSLSQSQPQTHTETETTALLLETSSPPIARKPSLGSGSFARRKKSIAKTASWMKEKTKSPCVSTTAPLVRTLSRTGSWVKRRGTGKLDSRGVGRRREGVVGPVERVELVSGGGGERGEEGRGSWEIRGKVVGDAERAKGTGDVFDKDKDGDGDSDSDLHVGQVDGGGMDRLRMDNRILRSEVEVLRQEMRILKVLMGDGGGGGRRGEGVLSLRY